MTVNLLKRLEGSVEAFRLTLGKPAHHHLTTRTKIDAFNKTGHDAVFIDRSPAFERAEPDEDEEFSDIESDVDSESGEHDDQIGGKVRISLSDMDLPAWEHDLRADLTVIEELLAEMRKITPADDAKLQHLKTQILSKLASPINPGNKKILIFTAFADTANYLYDNLAARLLKTQHLHTGIVTGTQTPKSTIGRGYDFQSLLTLFSPLSKEKAVIMPQQHTPGHSPTYPAKRESISSPTP